MGKEEVQERICFILEASLEANRTCAGEQEVQREGLVWR
jgi:hypothetical protein